MGIRGKLTLPLLLAFLLLMTILHLLWIPQQLDKGRLAFIDHQNELLTALESDLVRHLIAQDLAALHATLNDQMNLRQPDWRQLILTDAEGNRLYPLVPDEMLDDNVNLIRVQHGLFTGKQKLGQVSLILDWEHESNKTRDNVLRLELFLLAAFGLVFLISLFWQNRLVRTPLSSLHDASKRLADGDFDVHLPTSRNDEIGQLSQAFEHMRCSILESREALSKALTDARAGEFRHKAILSNMADGLVTLDTNGRITDFNQAAETIFGFSAEEIRHHSLKSLLSEEDQGRLLEILNLPVQIGVAATGQRWELVGRRKDGQQFPLDLNITNINLFGARSYTAILRDITHRKEAERIHVEARKMAEAASRAKSEFLATMSHEIRTPMNGVLGVTQLLTDTPLDEEQRKLVELIDQSGHSLLRIINDILDFSKIEAGKIELDSERFDLRAALLNVIHLLRPQAEDKVVALNFDYSDQCPVWVEGDPTRVRQIALNLVGNAVKFTEKGSVTLKVYSLETRHTRRPGMRNIAIEVIDTGIGIDPETQARIFSPFTQADGSTTRQYGGTGLGLAISKRLIELMDGDLQLKSAPGEGSTFHIHLPMSIPDINLDTLINQQSEKTGQNTRICNQECHVLLVEDVATNRLVATAMLHQQGMTVDEAENGKLALEKLAERDYDLILMDIRMPIMDGLETTQHIRAAEEKGQHIPIIALTANATQDDRQTCLNVGMDDFLPKPVTREHLEEVLRRWIQPS